MVGTYGLQPCNCFLRLIIAELVRLHSVNVTQVAATRGISLPVDTNPVLFPTLNCMLEHVPDSFADGLKHEKFVFFFFLRLQNAYEDFNCVALSCSDVTVSCFAMSPGIASGQKEECSSRCRHSAL